MNGDEVQAETRSGEALRDDSFLILFNAHFEDITFRLPARRFGTRWEVVLSTGRCECDRLTPGSDVGVENRSVVVLRRA